MSQTAKLGNDDGDYNEYLGTSVSISGNIIVGGAYKDAIGTTESGSAYIFKTSTGLWTDTTQAAVLSSSEVLPYKHFGESVSISGDNIMVGSYYDDSFSNEGAAYAYTKPSGGWITTAEAVTKLVPTIIYENEDDNYGITTAIDGNYAVIGAPNSSKERGCAYVLYYNGTTWDVQARLQADSGLTREFFGQSVSISGDNIVVGAHSEAYLGLTSSGAAYVFSKPIGGWQDMTETAKFTASDAAKNDFFGISVSISGDNIVVGAFSDDINFESTGSAYIFTKPSNGWINATQNAKLTASDGEDGDRFGHSVSISDDQIVVGAYHDQDGGAASGSAYVYSKPTLGWADMSESGKLTASDPNNSDYFGKSVSISNNTIVIGSANDDDNGSGSGSAYVFIKPGSGWANATQNAKLTASDGAASHFFGECVNISGDNIVVGAYQSNFETSVSYAGAAYVFTKPNGGWIDMDDAIKISANDVSIGQRFGASVSISGNNIVVGAYVDNQVNQNTGAAYLFEKQCDPIDLTISNDTQILTADQTGATYKWLDCNNNNTEILNATNQSYTATVAGNYAVEITVGSCVDTSACEQIIITGVYENLLQNKIEIYPNPTNGMVSINLNNQSKPTIVKLIDILGKEVAEYILTEQSNTLQLNLDNGVYYLLVEKTSQKIVVRR
jgi:hypothetical protein